MIIGKCLSVALLAILFRISAIPSEPSFVRADKNQMNGDLEEQKTFRVTAQLNYSELAIDDSKLGDSLEASQRELAAQRERVRAYHSDNNKAVLSKLDLPQCVSVSAYSPFLCATFESFDEAESFAFTLDQKLGKESLANVWVEPIIAANLESQLSEEGGSGPTRENYSNVREQLAPMLGEDTPLYDGSGIKIGIIDGSLIQSTFLLSGHSITYGGGTNGGAHPTMMAVIAAGDDGAAPGADLLSYSYGGTHTFIEAFDWMVQQGANVISYALMYTGNHLYNGECAYLDYMVRATGISFTVAAGNESEGNYWIPSPGLAANALTVGRISSTTLLPEASCYVYDSAYSGILSKPTIMAPGSDFIVTDINGYSGFGGTSMSAPAVAGMIALLMEEHPDLIAKPSLFMSSIINGAYYTANQTTFWDAVSGAGIAYYPSAREILSDNLFETYSYGSYYGNGHTIKSVVLDVYPGDTLDVVDTHLVSGNGSTSYNVGSPSAITFTTHQINILDTNNNVLASSSVGPEIVHAHYKNQTSDVVRVTASVKIVGNNVGGQNSQGAVTFYGCKRHVCSSYYQYHDQSWDKAYCACGDYELVMHLLSATDIYTILGHTYRRCVNCGHYIDTAGGFFPIDPTL